MAQDVKTVCGVAIASVKTVVGVAIASVKTIVGVDNTAGGGALAIDDRDRSAGTVTSPDTISGFTVTATSPLIVAVVQLFQVAISGVTWKGSESFTHIGSSASGSLLRVDLYGLKNPTTGTDDIVVTFGAAPSQGTCAFAISTTGGDTTTGWRASSSRNDADGTGPGMTLANSVSGDIVLHGAVVYNGATIVFDVGEDVTNTSRNNILFQSFSGGLSSKAAVGANTVVGCTDVASYAEIAVAIIPA